MAQCDASVIGRDALVSDEAMPGGVQVLKREIQQQSVLEASTAQGHGLSRGELRYSSDQLGEGEMEAPRYLGGRSVFGEIGDQ